MLSTPNRLQSSLASFWHATASLAERAPRV
jgi:hypothetical protein